MTPIVARSTSLRPPASTVVSGPASRARPDPLAASFAASTCSCGGLSAAGEVMTSSSALSCALSYPGITSLSFRRGGRCRSTHGHPAAEARSAASRRCRLSAPASREPPELLAGGVPEGRHYGGGGGDRRRLA